MFWPATGDIGWYAFFLICALFGIAGAFSGWVLWHNVSKYVNRAPKQPDDNARVA
jgi:hypothetical protein